MRRFLIGFVVVTVALFGGNANAAIFVEDFEATFPAWESGWLGSNSNLQNYYGVSGGRGNNPDGLWLDDGDGIYNLDVCEINFTPSFGETLTSLSIDVAGYTPIELRVFDMSHAPLLDIAVALTYGAFTDPGTYASYSVTSGNGISGFSFSPLGQVEGNTSIDNVVVNQSPAVPEPATIIIWSLLWSGSWLGMGVWRRRGRAEVTADIFSPAMPAARRPWSPEARQAIHEIIARGSHQQA